MQLIPWRSLAVLCITLLVPGAEAAPTLAAGMASGAPDQQLQLALAFVNDVTVTGLQVDLVYDPMRLTAMPAVAGPALAGTSRQFLSNVVAPGRVRVFVIMNPIAAIPSGDIALVPFTISAEAPGGVVPVELERVEMVDEDAKVVLPSRITAGSVTVLACAAAGDIHPDGAGNGRVELADFVLGRRKVLDLVEANAHDTRCGDLHPGVVACDLEAGADHWCPAGNGAFQLADLIVIRRLVAEVQVASCAACMGESAPAPSWRSADVAPRGLGDGEVDVADVVVALRFAVGLDMPSPDELLKVDVAPARGDGAVSVADVVLVLRAAVELESLEWPQRRVLVALDGAASAVAFVARVRPWPSWAEPTGAECATGEGALDSAGDVLAITCVADPFGFGSGAAATVTYRAPLGLDVEATELRVEAVDDALESLSAGGVLVPW